MELIWIFAMELAINYQLRSHVCEKEVAGGWKGVDIMSSPPQNRVRNFKLGPTQI